MVSVPKQNQISRQENEPTLYTFKERERERGREEKRERKLVGEIGYVLGRV